jgi:Ni,Fe-hydrogenase III large subunit
VSQLGTRAGRGGATPGEAVRVLRAGPASLEKLVRTLAGAPGARLADLFGAIEDGALILRIVYALDRDDEYVVVEWPLEGREYSPLSDIDPAAFVEECEIYEQFGARPSGPRLLNRLVVPPHAGHDFPRLGTPPPREGREPHAPHYVRGEAFEFPFGPVRAVAQESLYMGLVTSGEEIIDLFLLQWHKHRAIERRLQGLTLERALFIVERTEGLSAVANAWAFCQAAETVAGLAVPEAAQTARAVALELERLYNHAAAIAAVCQATGLSVGQAQAEVALEQFLRLNLACLGHRYLFGVIAVGGVSRGPDVQALVRLLPPAYDELRRVVEALWSTNSFMDRLEACGVVNHEQAERLALVGPVARASGCDSDTRRDHPFGPYRTLAGGNVNIPAQEKGDVLARMKVMAAEAEESRRLLMGLAEAGAGEGDAEVRGQAGAALGWCESPRGESLAWLSLDEAGRIQRARLRPGSFRNWRAFDDAARSRNVFTDAPIIEASFWLTVAGFAR